MRCSQENSQASATPACDGSRVYAAFVNSGALRVTATDLEGRKLWQSEAGAFVPEHGYASSPILYKSLIIVLGDNLKGSFIAGLDRSSGKVVWRTERNTTGWKSSYGSPSAGLVAGKWQVFAVGMGSVSGYEPESGRLLWSAEGPAEATAATAAFGNEMVFATGGDPRNEILAIRANGAGEVTETHVAWRSNRGVSYVPTPVYHDGKLYVLSDTGILSCFESQSGKQLWQGRLEGDFLASPVIAGGLLYVTNVAGKTFVVKTGAAFEIIAENDLGSGGRASLAICDGLVYVRTENDLYCIGKREALRTDYP
jgi:outer membrane protein assembly factor BamB